jgi:ribosome biogenesis protein MAK21
MMLNATSSTTRKTAMLKRRMCGRYASFIVITLASLSSSYFSKKAMQASMPPMAGDEDLMADSDSDPSGLDDSDSSDGEADVDEEDAGSGDDFSMAEGSDNEDLIDLDEVPQGLIEYYGSADEHGDGEESWSGFGSTKKRKQETESKREKRKRLRSLPTFASYEDYAKMIEDGPEDDI